MESNPLHVVLGATGGIGRSIVTALEKDGHQVRAVSRSGTAIKGSAAEPLAADISIPQGAIDACKGASVVYMAAMPAYYNWPTEFPPMIENVIAGAEAAGAKIVMVDNLYMYGPDVEDIYEDSNQNPPGHKGKARKAVAAQLLAAHEQGRVRVTLGRLSDYYGPAGDNTAAAVTLIAPALEGKTIRWGGHPDRQHTLHYLPDVGRAFVTLATSDRADGQAWILPAADALTGTEVVELVNRAADKPVKWSRPPKMIMTIAGVFSKMLRELKETMYQFEQRYVSHSDRFVATFGPFEVTPHETAIADTLDWYRSEGRVPKIAKP
jgi:nucleoside-diphosphate-sugar epimerase